MAAEGWRYPDGDINVGAAIKDRIVGFGLPNGSLRCVSCIDNHTPLHTADPRPIWYDSPPHNVENCDSCHRPLNRDYPTVA